MSVHEVILSSQLGLLWCTMTNQRNTNCRVNKPQVDKLQRSMVEKFRGMGSILSEHRRFSMGTRKDRNYLKRCRGAWLFTISDHIFCVNSTFFISPFQSLQQCTVAPHSPNRHALHYYSYWGNKHRYVRTVLHLVEKLYPRRFNNGGYGKNKGEETLECNLPRFSVE